MKTAALYVRSNNYHTREGFPRQMVLIEVCEKHGLKPTQIYYDRNCSAVSLSRPSLQALIRDLDKGYFDTLVTESVSQLTRNTKDLMTLIQIFRENNIRLMTPEGEIKCELPFIRE